MKIDATVYFDGSNAKIATIKVLREIFGLGLVEAKNLFEKAQYTHHTYRLTESQFGRLMLIHNEVSGSTMDLRVTTIRRVEEPSVDFDFSEGDSNQHPLVRRPVA